MRVVKTYIQKLKFLSHPAIVVLFICLALVTINLCVAQHTYSYDSDDVSWQTTLLTWSPFSGQSAYVGAKDNFLVNAPFIYFFEHIFKLSRAQLLAEAIFFALVNFTLFYVAALYFLKKVGVRLSYVSLLPFIWLASFGSGLATSFLNTNWRDYEFGVSFLFYMLAAQLYYGEIKPLATLKSKLATLVVLSLAALYTYSDPYFFYFTLMPIAAWFCLLSVLKRTDQRKTGIVIGFSLIALVVGRVLTSVFARVGILAPRGAIGLTSLHNLHRTLEILVSSLENIFSIDFSKNILVSLGNVVLLVLILFLILGLRTRLHQHYLDHGEKGLAVKVFFALLGAFSILAYIAIGNAIGGNSRYLVLFVYVSAMLIALSMNSFGALTSRIVVIAILATAILNTTSALGQLQNSGAAAESVNGSNYKLIDTIKKLGYTKGYAGYWDSNINTYLSKDSIKFLPVSCHLGKTIPLPLLVNGGLFNQAAPKTFFVIDPGNTTPKMCTENQVISQFGQPDLQVMVGNDKVLLYNYDLVTQMTNV